MRVWSDDFRMGRHIRVTDAEGSFRDGRVHVKVERVPTARQKCLDERQPVAIVGEGRSIAKELFDFVSVRVAQEGDPDGEYLD